MYIMTQTVSSDELPRTNNREAFAELNIDVLANTITLLVNIVIFNMQRENRDNKEPMTRRRIRQNLVQTDLNGIRMKRFFRCRGCRRGGMCPDRFVFDISS